MKKQLMIATILVSLLAINSFADTPKKQSKNFWVLETNIYNKTYSIINLYDSNALLIKSIKLDEYLNHKNKHDRKKIEKLIEQ